MEKLKVFLIIFSMLLGSCQSDTQKATVKDNIIEIDISKDYPKIKGIDRDIIEMEYVPLETNKDVLIGRLATPHYISEKYIIVAEYTKFEIFIFNRNGKIVSVISRRGKGAEEYTGLRDIVFDEKNEELFVFDNIGTGRVVVYSLTGEYKRTLRYSTDLHLTRAYEFDEETMLVYDTKGLYDGTYSKKPYMFMSKKDGSITSTLNISLPVRYSDKVFSRFTDSSGQPFTYSSSISLPNRRHFGQDFVISDISSDTIYRLAKTGDLIPLIVRTPSVHSTNPHLVCTSKLITDKYIFLHVTALDYISIQKEKAPPAKTLMYEFETGEITAVEHTYFENDLKILQKNTDARLFEITELKNAYEKNKLEGELKQLAATLGEEDNPVVMIVKFK